MLIYFKNFFTFFSFFICISLHGMEIIPDELAQRIMPFIITADQGIQSLTKSVVGLRSTNKKLYEIIKPEFVKQIWDKHKWTLMEKMCSKYNYPRFDFALYFDGYDSDMKIYRNKNTILLILMTFQDDDDYDPNFTWPSHHGPMTVLEQIFRQRLAADSAVTRAQKIL